MAGWPCAGVYVHTELQSSAPERSHAVSTSIHPLFFLPFLYISCSYVPMLLFMSTHPCTVPNHFVSRVHLPHFLSAPLSLPTPSTPDGSYAYIMGLSVYRRPSHICTKCIPAVSIMDLSRKPLARSIYLSSTASGGTSRDSFT